MINSTLTKDAHYVTRKISDSFIHKYYIDKMPISLSRWQFSHIGFNFPDDKVHLVNTFMEDLFETHLFMWADAGVQVGRQRKACIEQFAKLHNIETEIDISLDALVRKDRRIREGKEKEDIPFNTLRSMEYRKQKAIQPLRHAPALQISLFQ